MLSSWIELSASALQSNVATYKRVLEGKSKFAAVVKSNAYGHGLLEIAKLSLEAGADYLGVNSIEEAVALRSEFPKAVILIMGDIPLLVQRKEILANENFWIIVSRLEQIETLASLHPRPKIHLKIDTGMARLGTGIQALSSLAKTLAEKKLPLDGVATHFASTEDFTEHSYSHNQLVLFKEAISILESHGFQNLQRHASSSASALLFPEARFDFVRVGISLYGLWPSLETKLSLSQMGRQVGMLQPVLQWKTQVQHLQSLQTGQFVGYGSTFKTTYPTKLAVVPVGYFEGLDRKLSNNGYMLMKGERVRILGRICMNMTMLDVTHIPDVAIGDEVVIFGESGNEKVTPDDHATWTNTINYEVVTRISSVFPRIIRE